MNKLIDQFSSPRRSTRDLSLNILATLLLALLFTLINPNFIGKYNLISIGQTLAPYAMLSLGELMPISMGGTDLSVGTVCIGSAVVAGTLYNLGMPLIAVIPVMILFGSLIGLLNGYLIAKRHLPSFIATLGTMMFVRGIAALFSREPTVLFPSGCWYNNLFSSYKGIPVSFGWVLLFAFGLYFIYRRTRLGRYFISIGSNEKAARISGVDVDKYTILGYMGSGLMAGVAGIFWTVSFATVTVATGNGMELDALAGVYIGGTSAAGGLANVFGCIIGALMLVVIRSGLNFSLARLNTSINSTYVTFALSGLIVIAAVWAEKAKQNPSRKKKNTAPRKRALVRLVSYGLSAALLCSLFVLGFGSTSGNNPASQEDDDTSAVKTICVVMKSEGNDYWNTVTEGAQAAGAEFGYNVICRGTESEDASFLPKHREIVSTLLAEKPVGFAISTFAEGYIDLMTQAYEQGTPVVQFDTGLFPNDEAALIENNTNPLRSTIRSSDYANGALAAQHAFEAVYDDIVAADSYTVGVIQSAVAVTIENRGRGFSETFKELADADPKTAGKVTVLTEVKTSDANNACKDALEFLFEKDAKLIFGCTIFAMNQCADAVQSAGGKYDGVKFVGFDTGEKMAEWMKTDSPSPLLGTVSQNPYQLGYLAVKTIADIAQGNEYSEKIIVPGEWVSPENIDNYT